MDPPKATASEALGKLHANNVNVKILTGDNDIVTGNIANQVGLPTDRILLGSEIEGMEDAQLAGLAESVAIFAKLSPSHKERIIRALQSKGHVVGFMGDGINDAPALKAADVGISVNSAVDIAKESSDIILLENSLLVLEEGVIEGRKVFGNIIKYIKMAASSNFGNMFSVMGASLILPFLPMLPLQVLTNNLLYDFSQTAIPTDTVDAEWLVKPRKWELGSLRRYILYIGPISSIFDYMTFFIMWFVFHCANNPDSLPNRMVCGVDFYTDVDHPRHPHEQNSLHRKLGKQVINPNISYYRGYCGLVDHIAACEDFGIRSFARRYIGLC